MACLTEKAAIIGPSKVRADEALKRLLQGKARFVSGRLIHAGPEQIPEARGTVAKQLQEAEPILAERVQSGKLKIVTARYGLDTSKIDLVIH